MTAIEDGAARRLACERRSDRLGRSLPERLRLLCAEVRASLLDQAAAAIGAADVHAAGAALDAQTRHRASGSLPPWEAVPRETRHWWLSRAALARDERVPLPAIAPIALRSQAADATRF